jgi:chemotaxis protein CheX
MSPQFVERIDALVESAARGLFATHGPSLGALRRDSGAVPPDHDIACSIGFTSPHVHGALLMTARKHLMTRSRPAELRHDVPSEHQVCDWAGELVNQLLGRVKNALAPLGLVLEQSTPTVVVGWQVHRAPASTAVARRYVFDQDGGTVAIYFDAVVAEGFALLESPNEGLASAAEGDVQLF